MYSACSRLRSVLRSCACGETQSYTYLIFVVFFGGSYWTWRDGIDYLKIASSWAATTSVPTAGRNVRMRKRWPTQVILLYPTSLLDSPSFISTAACPAQTRRVRWTTAWLPDGPRHSLAEPSRKRQPALGRSPITLSMSWGQRCLCQAELMRPSRYSPRPPPMRHAPRWRPMRTLSMLRILRSLGIG